MEDGQAYAELNRQWKATCRVVLGGEIGELSDYSGWLSNLNDPLPLRQSSISGKQIVMTSSSYCQGSKTMDMSEADFFKKFEPLSINDIKDMDSILEAIAERSLYCGNITIGNSKYVENSSYVSDSFFVQNSVKISGCKNVAYSQWMRLSENIFGTNEGGESKFCLRCGIVYRNQRAFELWIGGNTSDSYYSYGLEDCQECIFCFNLVGKSHSIGNILLPRDKYSGLKKKLLAEIRQELVEKRKLPSLIELVAQGSEDHSGALGAVKGLSCQPRDKCSFG